MQDWWDGAAQGLRSGTWTQVVPVWVRVRVRGGDLHMKLASKSLMEGRRRVFSMQGSGDLPQLIKMEKRKETSSP